VEAKSGKGRRIVKVLYNSFVPFLSFDPFVSCAGVAVDSKMCFTRCVPHVRGIGVEFSMEKKKVVTEELKKSESDSLMHPFKGSGTGTSSPIFSMKVILILIVAALFGVGTGYVFAGGANKPISGDSVKNASQVQKGQKYGAGNTSVYKDSAEGVLKKGGVDGEGEFHLERPGGESQNVYVTSSSVDLSVFLNRKIKVRGQTFAAQKAGWLMDVGQVEVLN